MAARADGARDGGVRAQLHGAGGSGPKRAPHAFAGWAAAHHHDLPAVSGGALLACTYLLTTLNLFLCNLIGSKFEVFIITLG